jgi:acetyl esterase/lipase
MSRLRAAALFAVICSATTTFAATLQWTGASDNRWNNAANWNPAQLPQSGDTLLFNSATNPNLVNDLPPGTVLHTVAFASFPAVSRTVSGTSIEVSTELSGGNPVTISAPVRAMGTLLVSGELDFTSTFDVNGRFVTLGGATFHGPVTGSGTLHSSVVGGTVTYHVDSPFSGRIEDTATDGCSSFIGLFANFPNATVDVACWLTTNGTFGPLTTSGRFSPGTTASPSTTKTTARATSGNATFISRRGGSDGNRPYLVEIGGTTAGSGYDQLKVNGTVTIQGGFLTVDLFNGFTPSAGDTFVIVDNDGTDAVSGTFHKPCFGCAGDNYAEGGTVVSGGTSFRISYVGGTGNDIVLTAIGTSSTALNTSPNPSKYSQTVTLTATVSGSGPTPTGTVSFTSNNVSIGTAPLVNGVAALTTSTLGAGPNTVRATYSGDSTYGASTSANVVQTVQTTQTSTTLTSTPNPSTFGQPVTFTSTSTREQNLGPVTNGSFVTFLDGTTTLGHERTTSGVAVFTTSALAPGSHNITARFETTDNANENTSTSNVVVQVVNELPLTILSADETIAEGNSGQTVARVTLRLSSASTQLVTARYATADATATSGSDYVADEGTVTFAPGETRATIAITINGDVTPEPNERFNVRLSNPQNALLQRSQVGVTILNDDDAFTVVRDLEYANAGGMSLMLDLFIPIDDKIHPVIVGIDAGDWNTPIRQTSVITREASRGYAVAMLSFRPASSAPMPAQIADVKAAIRWLRANAERFDLDPSRIGAWGIGAGGHLAALLGTTNGEVAFDEPSLGNPVYPSGVRAIVDWYGATNLASLAADSAVCGDTAAQISQLLGCTATSCADKARTASATTFVTRNDAAFLIMHGSNDCNVPLSQSRALDDALRAAGVDSTLIVNEGAGHGGMNWSNESLLRDVDAFFDRVLMPLAARDRRARR